MIASEIECKSKNEHDEVDLFDTNSKISQTFLALFQGALQFIKNLVELKALRRRSVKLVTHIAYIRRVSVFHILLVFLIIFLLSIN